MSNLVCGMVLVGMGLVALRQADSVRSEGYTELEAAVTLACVFTVSLLCGIGGVWLVAGSLTSA